jgi:hypothetical protein
VVVSSPTGQRAAKPRHRSHVHAQHSDVPLALSIYPEHVIPKACTSSNWVDKSSRADHSVPVVSSSRHWMEWRAFEPFPACAGDWCLPDSVFLSWVFDVPQDDMHIRLVASRAWSMSRREKANSNFNTNLRSPWDSPTGKRDSIQI